MMKYLILLACLFPASLPASEEIREIVLGDRVLVLQRGPWEDNLAVIDAGPSLIAVDAWSSPLAAARARAIMEDRFHKPVSHVFNTHHHWDHTFGNQAFDGATIVGHATCAEGMAKEYSTPASRLQALEHSLSPGLFKPMKDYIRSVETDIEKGFRLAPPSHLVDDREVLKIGDLTCKFYHAPGLHTRSNLTVFIPELGLLFTRREFDGRALPVLEAGADLDKLIGSLADITASGRPVQFLIPGHGQPLADPDLSPALSYLRTLAATVREYRSAGKGMAELRSAAALTAFRAVRKYPENHQANLDIAWQESSRSIQPDPVRSPTLAADQAAIERLHRTDMAASKVHDIRTLITLWTDDGILFLPGREPIRGKAAIWDYMREQLPESQKYEISEYHHQFEEVQVLGDWAYEWATFTGTYRLKSGGPELHERARVFRVLRRQQDGSWKCHRAVAQDMPEERDAQAEPGRR